MPFPEWTILTAAVGVLRAQLDRASRDEDGLTTVEWTVLVAAVVAMALAIVAIIRRAVQAKANSINLG